MVFVDVMLFCSTAHERTIYTGIFATSPRMYHWYSVTIKVKFCMDHICHHCQKWGRCTFSRSSFHTSKIPNAPFHLKYPIPNAEVTRYGIQILIFAVLSPGKFTHFSGVQSTSLTMWCRTERETNMRFEQTAPLAERPSKGFHPHPPPIHIVLGPFRYKMLNIRLFCVHCKTYSFYRQHTVPKASSGHQIGLFFFLLLNELFYFSFVNAV